MKNIESYLYFFQNMSERLAENSHDQWAKKKKEELEALGNLFYSIVNHNVSS